MEVPLAVIVGSIILVVALLLPRLIGPGSTPRRRTPGVILIALGFALLGSQLPPSPERLLFGVAMLLAWGGTGLALVAGKPWARLPGLVLSAVGVAVAGWVYWRVDQWANELGRSDDRALVDAFFLADGPYFSWIEVAGACLAFVVLSALAGGLLLLRVRSPSPASTRQ
jgi:hypothetical protein